MDWCPDTRPLSLYSYSFETDFRKIRCFPCTIFFPEEVLMCTATFFFRGQGHWQALQTDRVIDKPCRQLRQRWPPSTEQLPQQEALFLSMLSKIVCKLFSTMVFLGWPQFTLHILTSTIHFFIRRHKLNICVGKEHLKCLHLGIFIPAAIYNGCKHISEIFIH